MNVPFWAWVAVLAVILGMLLIDLLVFQREAHAVTFREAAIWSVVWVSLGLGFAGVLFFWAGPQPAGEYLAGYLIEKSLSVDNIFVFALLFSFFAVPAAYQHRVLFWGVLGALVMRGAFIAGGAALLKQFHWTLYVFGAFLVFTGIKMARHHGNDMDPSKNILVRALRRAMPMSSEYHGEKFFIRRNGALMATPLLAVLVAVESTDLLFAVDSIPAIFAVTSEPFLVFTSNAFAILGLRALYFLLAGMMTRFVYLRHGLAAVLVLVGTKMLVSGVYHPPVWLSLLGIAAILGVAIGASLWVTRDEPLPEDDGPLEQDAADAPALQARSDDDDRPNALV